MFKHCQIFLSQTGKANQAIPSHFWWIVNNEGLVNAYIALTGGISNILI